MYVLARHLAVREVLVIFSGSRECSICNIIKKEELIETSFGTHSQQTRPTQCVSVYIHTRVCIV